MNKKILILAVLSQIFVNSNCGFPTYVPTLPTFSFAKTFSTFTSKNSVQSSESPELLEKKCQTQLDNLQSRLKILPLLTVITSLTVVLPQLRYTKLSLVQKLSLVCIIPVAVYWREKNCLTSQIDKLHAEAASYRSKLPGIVLDRVNHITTLGSHNGIWGIKRCLIDNSYSLQSC